jgi:hypothetical protein
VRRFTGQAHEDPNLETSLSARYHREKAVSVTPFLAHIQPPAHLAVSSLLVGPKKEHNQQHENVAIILA